MKKWYFMIFIMVIINSKLVFSIEEGPGDLYRTAKLLLKERKYNVAILNLKKLDLLYQNQDSIKVEIAKAYIEAGDENTAIGYYESGIRLKDNSIAVFEYGNLLYTKQEYTKALEVFKQDNEKTYANYLGAALSAKKLNLLDDAEDYYIKAMKKNRGNEKIYLHIGKLYFEQKKIDKAIEYFKKYNKLTQNEKSYILLANAYILKEDKEAAKKVLKDGLNVLPKNQNLNKILISIVIDKNIQKN